MQRLLARLAFVSVVLGAAMALREWRRARAAGEVPFPALRRFGNERLDPWVMRLGLAGGRHSEIATIEHVGRTSGTVRYTPVHATFADDDVWIPLPYGELSQWARNVVAAGGCRLQLHESLHELGDPAIVAPAEDPLLARPVQLIADELGIRYLRLHRVASVPGTFATHGAAPGIPGGHRPLVEAPLDGVFEVRRGQASDALTTVG